MSDARLPINHGDTGKVSRDKINDSFNDLVETVAGYRPHIENGIWWIGETNTGVKARGDSVSMKVEDGYIRYKSSSVNNWTQIIAIEDLKGDKGDQGDAATITVGSTTTGAAGSSASVENVGTSGAAIFNFTIPRGAKGEPGQDGEDGQDGENATIEIGTTTTGEPGTDASVTNTGTSTAAVLNFTIPEGAKGDPGQDGEDGNGISSITSSKSGKITTVTITETNGDSASFQISDGQDGQGSGDVLGPNSSVDGNVVLFDGTSGKYIKDSGKVIPTQASDIGALPSSTKYGASLTVSIDSDYKVTTTLKDQDGNTLGTAQVIDLPLESVVVGGSYDDQTKKVILTLQNGNTIEFSVADLVSGLQSEITSSNKLDADLVDDSTSTNKFVTASDKTAWGGKQDALTLPATPTQGNLVTWGADNKTLADGGAVPTVPTNVSDFNNDAGYLTSSTGVTSVNGNNGAVTVNDTKVASSAPTATEGTLWYDSANDKLKAYNGSSWDEIGGGITKVFTLSSTSDLTTAQAALDWYNAGGNPIIKLNAILFNLHYISSTGAMFGRVYGYGNGVTTLISVGTINFTISSGSVTAIVNNNNNINKSTTAPTVNDGTITLVI